MRKLIDLRLFCLHMTYNVFFHDMVKTKQACKQFRTAYISENPGKEKGIPFLVQYDCYPLFQTLWWYILLNIKPKALIHLIIQKKKEVSEIIDTLAQVFLTGHKYSHM